MQTVLIIGDARLFADAAAGSLRRAGVQVLTVARADEGLDLVRERRPSLVLLDLAMPGVSGVEVLRAIRADPDPAVAGTPVLVVSASSDAAGLAEVQRLGGHGNMLKGRFSLSDLVGRVQELIDGLPPRQPG